MGRSEGPEWIGAAIPAAVRLAAEAGAEVDDILAQAEAGGGAAARLTHQVDRLHESAEREEVATDLAGLLWAECEDVPRIATILDEPAAQAALEAVAEARRLAARRLADHLSTLKVRTRTPAVPVRPGLAPKLGPSVVTGPHPAHFPLPPARLDTPRLAPPQTLSRKPGPLSAAGALAAGAAAAVILVGRRLRRA